MAEFDFHGAGNAICGNSDILHNARLDFTVSKQKLITYYEKDYPTITDKRVISFQEPSDYNGIRMKDYCAIIRDDTKQPLAIMGSGYEIVQNYECLGIMEAIVEQSEKNGQPIKIVRGGVICNCNYLFLVGKLPYDMEITNANGKIDSIKSYIMVQWSHTGAGKVAVSFLSYDSACGCFLYPGTSDLQKSIRHTKNARPRLDEAQEYLNSSYKALSAFTRKLSGLTSKKFGINEMKKLISTLYGEPDENSKRGKTVADNRESEILSQFSLIQEESAYGAYKAICKYQDEDATVKQKKVDKDESELAPKSELRLFSSLYGNSSKGKKNALLALTNW